MLSPKIGAALLCTLAATSSVNAAESTFRSGPARTQLLELFTSEGCSSCPPAEGWFTTLRQSKRLWKDVVPVAFHVDYWDGLGWRDPFASKAFSNRQHTYAAAWGAQTVYTPCFVLSGAEWREHTLEAIPVATKDAGTLTATVAANGMVEIAYIPPKAMSARKWRANAAVLGFGVASNVKAGENGGRRLIHDFVALAHQTVSMSVSDSGFRALLPMPSEQIKHGQSALAAWVTEENASEPMQATGGEL